jgi:hypothetical protein
MAVASTVTMSRGRDLDVSRPEFYQDLLTGIAREILNELSEIEKVDLGALPPDDFDQVVSITQIRLLNELYYCLGQLRAQERELDVKRAIQDLRDIWNRLIDGSQRPQALKFPVEGEEQVQ